MKVRCLRTGLHQVTISAGQPPTAATTSFTWTGAPPGSGIVTTPLLGYQGLCLDVAGDSTGVTVDSLWASAHSI